MKTYLIICLIMMVLVEIRVYSVILVVKKKYPNEFKIKRTNFLQKIVATVKLLIYFLVPILNLIVFVSTFFLIKTTDLGQMIEKKYIGG